MSLIVLQGPKPILVEIGRQVIPEVTSIEFGHSNPTHLVLTTPRSSINTPGTFLVNSNNHKTHLNQLTTSSTTTSPPVLEVTPPTAFHVNPRRPGRVHALQGSNRIILSKNVNFHNDDLMNDVFNNYGEYSVVFQGFLQNTHTSSEVSHGFPRPAQSHIKTENIAANTLKSEDLAGHFKKPQEMNSNLNEPFTAFKQANELVQELPKSSLEIDLGPVNDIQPVLPLTTSHDVVNFFSPAKSPADSESQFSVSSPDLGDDKITTSDTQSQTDNGQHQSEPAVRQTNKQIEIPVIIETVINGSPDTEHFLSDFQFEDHPASSLGKLTLDESSDSDQRIRDSLITDKRPSVTSLRGEQSHDNQPTSPPQPPSRESSQQGITDSLLIDLDEDKNIIPKIPGNSVSFSFTRFGTGERATSFGVNFNKEVGRNRPVIITTPRVETTSRPPTTTRRTVTTTTTRASVNPFPTLSPEQFPVRTVLQQAFQASPAPVINPFPTLSPQHFPASPTPVRTTTAPSTTRAPPNAVVHQSFNPFPGLSPGQVPIRTVLNGLSPGQLPVRTVLSPDKQLPVVFTRRPVVSVSNPQEKPRTSQRGPPSLPSTVNSNNNFNDKPFKIVNGAKPPRPNSPPPKVGNPARQPLRTTKTLPSPVVSSTGSPVFVFSTPSPAPVTTSRPPVFLSPVTFKPFVFMPELGGHSAGAVNEIVIPLNITETRQTDTKAQRGNGSGQLNLSSSQESQLPRKPKNQLLGLRGKPLENTLGNSPFVFLRQQLQEVKQNIFLPSGLTGLNNPFQPSPHQLPVFSPFPTIGPSVGPSQSPRPSFFQTASPISPVRQDPEASRRPVVPFVFSNPTGIICLKILQPIYCFPRHLER